LEQQVPLLHLLRQQLLMYQEIKMEFAPPVIKKTFYQQTFMEVAEQLTFWTRIKQITAVAYPKVNNEETNIQTDHNMERFKI